MCIKPRLCRIHFPLLVFVFVCFLIFKCNSLHRRTGDERTPLLSTVIVVKLVLLFSTLDDFFCFCFFVIFFLFYTYRPSRTYVPTTGTEQYRGDHWGFLGWAACEGSQQAFTQTIYSRRLSVHWICSKASWLLAWESSGLSSEPQILQRTAGATAGRTLTWEVSMTTDSP